MPSEKNSSSENNQSRQVKLAAKSVWKVFGEGASDLFAGGRTPGDAELNGGPHIAAVRDASFDVFEGEIFIVMGLSGSGKSTLLRCMTRLIEPTAGEVLFDGQDLRKVSPAALTNLRRHKMGMVFQHFALLPHRDVLGNVAFPLEVQGTNRAECEQRALAAIELVGLAGRETYYPAELSGGQQQRVGIARSLVVEPDVWFLDEPFSALDPLIRREMQDEFLRLQSVLHKTIVFITHDFEEAIRLADRIAIMKDGRIIQIGTSEDLVLNPATDYVAEFTKGIPRAKVLSVGVLSKPRCKGRSAGTLLASSKIGEVVEAIVQAPQGAKFKVEDENGSLVGELSREDAIAVLSTGTESQ